MKIRSLLVSSLVGGVMAAASGYAAAPKGSTGECKDGSYTTAENKSGACSGHDGVKDWYGADKASAAKPTAKSAAKTEARVEPPKGSTGECKDGSYTSADSKSGACSGHGGVKDWYANDKAPAAKPTAKSDAKTEVKAEAPKGSTGECKDGSYTSAESKSGACSGHGGVKDWYAKDKSAAMPSNAPAAAGGSAAPGEARSRAEAGPGGAGRVWVNSSTKVYHCSNDRWYGKTQHGEYMSEAQAKAQGNHADHGKPCN
jgi:Protein of unknown function (DUF3761)